MEPSQVVEIIKSQAPMVVQYILMGLGGLVVAGITYIKLTPNQDDDKWFAKLESTPFIGIFFKILVAFAPVQRKDNSIKVDEPKNS